MSFKHSPNIGLPILELGAGSFSAAFLWKPEIAHLELCRPPCTPRPPCRNSNPAPRTLLPPTLTRGQASAIPATSFDVNLKPRFLSYNNNAIYPVSPPSPCLILVIETAPASVGLTCGAAGPLPARGWEGEEPPRTGSRHFAVRGVLRKRALKIIKTSADPNRRQRCHSNK